MRVKLTKRAANALRAFADMGATWTITMSPERYADVLKLEKLGLVYFEQRFNSRGRAKDGYYVKLTPAGLAKVAG